MAEGAIEDAPLAVATDPDHSVVVVRARGVAVGRLLRSCGIEAYQDVQLLSRVRPGGEEVIELVEEVEILSCQIVWSGDCSDLQSVSVPRLAVVFMSSRLGADEVSEFRHIHAGEGGRMQSRHATAFFEQTASARGSPPDR